MRSAIGRFAVRNVTSILFVVLAICAAGTYCALNMPSSVFPQTNFPRVVIVAHDGVVPASEMMARVTRPVEQAVKEVPGSLNVRSITGRGTAEIDLFFSWGTDMVQSELFVNSRLSELRNTLPAAVELSTHRMTFSVFPIIGISLTSPTRPLRQIWEFAQYTLKPQLLRIAGLASVDLVGGSAPEYHVQLDLAKLTLARLGVDDVVTALSASNLLVPAGLHEEDHSLFLTTVDGRVRSSDEIANLPVVTRGGGVIRIGDVGTVERSTEPVYTRVSADGKDAVLLNLYSQPDASTLSIANALKEKLKSIRRQLPADVRVAYFYDQSLLVHDSVLSVWEAIAFGLILSVAILYLFLKNWGSTLVATVVIPVAVLCTVVAMKLCGMSFNLMTLGGIAAAVGLVIDDAIVVVEAIYAQVARGLPRAQAVTAGLSEIFAALLGSTLTPVVIFIPLAFLDGISGVFFRALALTMTVSLITSLVLAITLTPSLASWLVSPTSVKSFTHPEDAQVGGIFMRIIILLYERIINFTLKHRWFTVGLCLLIFAAAVILYGKLKSDFLPAMDEGGFVIDYIAPPGTAMSELNDEMVQIEKILRSTPEVESYSRRTGAALGVALVEPNTGDFLVKLRPGRKRSTSDVITELRLRINIAQPRTQWAFPGILTDLIGDLTWEDEPIEVKIFSNDTEQLKAQARHVAKELARIPGVVDVNNGLVYTGQSYRFHVRPADAQRLGLTTASIGNAVSTAMQGTVTSSVQEGDRILNIRVGAAPASVATIEQLSHLPLHSSAGQLVYLDQVADVELSPPELEIHSDDLRQDVAVLAELEGRDLGNAMAEIRSTLAKDSTLAPGSLEFGGMYEQQQQAFSKLIVVLVLALVLVLGVAILEFRSLTAPLAIIFGAALSAFGIVLALLVTGTSLSIVAFLGALIGMGIVHKNGILMMDYVEQLQASGMGLKEALIYSGRRRLRPVLMTSLAAAMGMLPLAWGFGSGTDMLRPLGVTVIGAVTASVLFSLIATPTAYYLMVELLQHFGGASGVADPSAERVKGA